VTAIRGPGRPRPRQLMLLDETVRPAHQHPFFLPMDLASYDTSAKNARKRSELRRGVECCARNLALDGTDESDRPYIHVFVRRNYCTIESYSPGAQKPIPVGLCAPTPTENQRLHYERKALQVVATPSLIRQPSVAQTNAAEPRVTHAVMPAGATFRHVLQVLAIGYGPSITL